MASRYLKRGVFAMVEWEDAHGQSPAHDDWKSPEEIEKENGEAVTICSVGIVFSHTTKGIRIMTSRDMTSETYSGYLFVPAVAILKVRKLTWL